MERKIGEIFEYNGEWYQAVDNTNSIMCSGCTFVNEYNECEADISVVGNCGCKDGNPLIFKKLEKVGEPYSCNYYGDNRLIMMQEYNLYNLDDVTNEDKIPMYITDYKHKRIAIEIKQNKEDMEEYKTPLPKEDNHLTRIVYAYVNGKISDEELIKSIKEMSDEYPYDKNDLKPFSLEAAQAGKPVCTRDGRKARIICFDANIMPGNKNILALIRKDDGTGYVEYYTSNGKFSDSKDDINDLMMLPEKKEGWVNVYKTSINYECGTVFSTEQEAKNKANDNRIATVRIEWKE